MNIISLGAGVQSSTMALMAANGEITPMPNCAIFADTQAEPKKVYEWLDWLEKQLPFPVLKVTAGNLTDLSLRLVTSKTGSRYLKHNIPAYTLAKDGSKGIKQRQCTMNFKIVPIKQKVRSLLKPKQKAVVWIGISLDEVIRMKESQVGYIRHVWPLIDKRMTRLDCLNWMERNGYPKPPRSACIFCPFHSRDEWMALSKPELESAIEYEKALQEKSALVMTSIPYLHKSCKPLSEVDLTTTEPDLFMNECEGHCGV